MALTDQSAAWTDPHARILRFSGWKRKRAWILINVAQEIRRRRNLAINDPQPGPRTDNDACWDDQ